VTIFSEVCAIKGLILANEDDVQTDSHLVWN